MPDNCPAASSSGSLWPGVRQPADDPARRRADRKHRPATSIGIMKVLDGSTERDDRGDGQHDAASVDSMRKRVIELEYGKVSETSRAGYTAAY